MNFTFPAIGIVRSCFKEKFGIPRQPGLAPLAAGQIEILPPFDDIHAFDGLEGSSHLWIQFVFHANQRQEWKPKVKPPRLGGNRSLGVFATRSPTRPAPIGLSVVRFAGLRQHDGKLLLDIAGIDLLEGTPVLDIKPYVPYVDRVADAVNTFAPLPPTPLKVEIPEHLLPCCHDYYARTGTDLAGLIVQVLQQDPRPQYQQPDAGRQYGMKLLDLDVRWRYVTDEDGKLAIHLTDLLRV